MECLSIRKCAQLQHVENKDVIKTARSVYVLADELIEAHADEMIESLPNEIAYNLCKFPQLTQRAFLFQSLNMALESFIGGAVEQIIPLHNEELQKISPDFTIYSIAFASWPYSYGSIRKNECSDVEYLKDKLESLKELNAEEGCVRTTYDFITGQETVSNVEVDVRHNNKKIQRTLENIEQVKAGENIRWSEDEAFEMGVDESIKHFDEEHEKILQKYNHFCSLRYPERAKEFDELMKLVFEINRLNLRKILRSNDGVCMRNDNSNQRR